MPNEKPTPKELKVTDKRIFTPEGDIRQEFQNEIRPAEPQAVTPSEPPGEQESSVPPPTASAPEPPKPREERRRSMAEKAVSPGTPFANFIQSLVAQAYMFLGMLRDPRQPQPIFDAEAAHETIDILTLLREKTTGNLTPDEEDFFDAHLGDLKLAYVQRTKSIG
ncbi:MAG: DUF1844 domain-containing protein [Acidobacteriota bacterium]|nr:DUF1844 domain-containing protein [Acidobacteriota bacterium]